MIAGQIKRGRATTTVTILEIVATDTVDTIFEAALVAARETRSSLFGWNVHWNGSDVAGVDLWTD